MQTKNRDNIKKRNDLFSSIMKNPKLSKALKEALEAPIGSTKREQAKSVLSIMKKMGGVDKNYDGKGGLITSGLTAPAAPSLGVSSPSSVNLNPTGTNLMFFPAMGSTLKTNNLNINNTASGLPSAPTPILGGSPNVSSLNGTPTKTNTPGSGSLNGLGTTGGGSLNGTGVTAFSPDNTILSPNISKGVFGSSPSPLSGSIVSKFDTSAGVPQPVAPKSSLSSLQSPYTSPLTAPESISGFNINTLYNSIVPKETPPVGTTTAQTSSSVAEKNASDLAKKAAADAVTKSIADNNAKKTAADALIKTDDAAKTDPYGTYSSSNSTSLGRAVNSAMGADVYGVNYADSAFGGDFEGHIANDEAKLRAKYGLEAKEQTLSDLTSMRENFVPTLQAYIKGKDQYLTFIDQMLQKTKGSILDMDMGNPAVAASYNKYVDYLTTLKGRQNARYSTYLDYAKSDYEANVTKAKDDYQNAITNFESEMTREGTLDQNKYNRLMALGTAMYTAEENKPIVFLNREKVALETKLVKTHIINDALGIVTDEKSLADEKEYKGKYADKDGGLNFEAVPVGGLDAEFTRISETMGRSPEPLVAAINEMIKTTVANAGKEKTTGEGVTKESTLKKIRELVNKLKKDNPLVAAQINPAVVEAEIGNAEDYIKTNLDSVKKAATELVSSTRIPSWWRPKAYEAQRTPGLADKASWKANNSGVAESVLDALYDNAERAFSGEGNSFKTNPLSYVTNLFTPKQNKTLESSIANELF